MAAPTIADYLKYANLQMAAEAFLKEKVPGTETWVENYSGDDLRDALFLGNKRYTRFTETEAKKFADDWVVLNQKPNTETGFSGTLFYNDKTTEYVLSFRSTEFVDDAVRDSLATNDMEVHETGWAWGQIADMEDWYESIKNLIPADVKPNVTGYSLGGHLATAFNLLHQDEIGQVITFNGAGVGKVKQDNLAKYDTPREAPDYFRNPPNNPSLILACRNSRRTPSAPGYQARVPRLARYRPLQLNGERRCPRALPAASARTTDAARRAAP
jgi:hypothetical protein